MVPIGATRVRRGCKAEPIDSFNGNKNTTNFWRRATYTAYNTRRIGRRGQREREKGWRGRRRVTKEERKPRDVTSRRHSD